MYFYSRIVCSCESSLSNSNFIFFKRNIREVYIFVLKKFLEAVIKFYHWSAQSWAGRATMHKEIYLLLFWLYFSTQLWICFLGTCCIFTWLMEILNLPFNSIRVPYFFIIIGWYPRSRPGRKQTKLACISLIVDWHDVFIALNGSKFI